ncbi:PAS domain-containing sensor histidine kinase [Dyadobacter bucti]|uniref:PAS domain-containing sensor histidine kinase n=1 Tax=Dyadobacter bucti TaxID=2572203 RepID=UPI00110871AB|nr:PAS domain-containing sensor histidine kinase [Dyadobacter bucti]
MIDAINSHDDNLLVAIERFELVAKATRDVIWDWDLVNGTVWWNSGMELIFGYAIGDVGTGPESWFDRIHPDDQEQVVKSIHDVIDQGGTNWADFYRFRRADGTYAKVHDRGYAIRTDGKAVRMVGSMIDVTEQLRLQEANRESEENLKFAMQAAQLGAWNLDPIGQTVHWDDRCRELYGFPSKNELRYENLVKFIHPGDRDRMMTAVRDALDPAIRSTYDIRYRTVGASDKKLRWLHCRGQAYFDNQGKAYRFSGISRDITDEVDNREKVLWADQQAAMTLEESGAGSFHVKLETDELIYTPVMAQIITGRESSKVTRDVFIRHIHPDDAALRLQAYQKAETTGQLRYEARFIWEDNSVHWIRAIGRYLYDSSGKAVSLSGLVMDITDRIESEQRLKTGEERYRQLAEELEQRVSQRTEELRQANQELISSNNNLQQFAYAASHDMKEPLRKIQSFSSRLQTIYGKEFDDNGTFMLNRIQDASSRMSLMIDDLLAYSRLTAEMNFEPVSLDELLASVLADLEISIQEQNAEITSDPLPEIWGNAGQLAQLIQNLLTNAIKYRRPDESPKIRITASDVNENEKRSLPALISDHPYVRLEISDNGIGFDEKYIERIFQMFQRLHGRGEFSGSGIGLAICKKVVQNHHGYISAKSIQGEGSTFVVYLPAVRQE